MERRDKRFYREMKRHIKQEGNKIRRAFLKKSLENNPEEAHWDEYEFGEYSSEKLNGMDNDSTRRKDDDGLSREDQTI